MLLTQPLLSYSAATLIEQVNWKPDGIPHRPCPALLMDMTSSMLAFWTVSCPFLIELGGKAMPVLCPKLRLVLAASQHA